MCLNIWIDVFFYFCRKSDRKVCFVKNIITFHVIIKATTTVFLSESEFRLQNSLYVNSLTSIRSFYQRCYHKLDILKINLYFLLQMCTSQSHTQGSSIRASSFVENIPCFGSEYLRSIIH